MCGGAASLRGILGDAARCLCYLSCCLPCPNTPHTHDHSQRPVPNACALLDLTPASFKIELQDYVPGGFPKDSAVPDRALQAARCQLSGDPATRVKWLPNLIEHLNKAGHVAELLTCDATTMKARLVHIAKLRHERQHRELGDSAPAFNADDWLFPTLDEAKTYVVGFNFIPKHMKEVYDEHVLQSDFC